MFQNYIFDLYGTLIDIITDEENPELWEKMCIFYGYRGAAYTPKELIKKYKEFCKKETAALKAAHPTQKYVDINLTKVFGKLYSHKNVEVSPELCALTANVFRCCSTKHIRLYDGVEDFLKELKKKGKKLYLLSNAQHDFTVPEIHMMELEKYFDDIIISADVECRKPDPHMYEILFERNNLKKEESIMIGNDYLSDIKSAFDFGIKSLYIDQAISPPIKGKLKANWAIMDGNFRSIMDIPEIME